MPWLLSFEPALSQVGVLLPNSHVHSLEAYVPLTDSDSLCKGVGSKLRFPTCISGLFICVIILSHDVIIAQAYPYSIRLFFLPSF